MGQLLSLPVGNKDIYILWHLFPAVMYKERCHVQDDVKGKLRIFFLYNYHWINMDINIYTYIYIYILS